jgi:hypothetical protein
MKFTRKYLRVLLGTLILCFANLTSSMGQIFDADALKFAISLDKEKYLVNEPIWLTLVLENTGKQQVYVPRIHPLDNKLTIFVVSMDGDTLESSYISGNRIGPEYLTFDKNEKDIYFLNILSAAYSVGTRSEEAFFSRLIQKGEYTIQAKLGYRHKEGNTQILSNKLSFKVENPTGKEKETYGLLIRGRRLYRERKRDEGAEMLWRIIKEYPNSAYRDAAYDQLSFQFDHREIALQFIQKYPNTGLVASVIFSATPKKGKPAERKKFFEDIIKSHPNTKAAMYAENQLDKWRRGKIWVDEPVE